MLAAAEAECMMTFVNAPARTDLHVQLRNLLAAAATEGMTEVAEHLAAAYGTLRAKSAAGEAQALCAARPGRSLAL